MALSIHPQVILPDIAKVAYPAGTVWFVSKAGADANDGLSPSRAKLTLAGLTALAAGDTIVIGPGTWTEKVDWSALASLRVIGAGMDITTITSATDGAGTPTIKGPSYFHNSNLTAVLTGALSGVEFEEAAISVTGGENGLLYLNNVRCKSTKTGLNFGRTGPVRLVGCHIQGAEHGANINMFGGGILQDTSFIATGWAVCNSTALTVSGLSHYFAPGLPQGGSVGIIENCMMAGDFASPWSDPTPYTISGLSIVGGCWKLRQCAIQAVALAGTVHGDAYGVYAEDGSTGYETDAVYLEGCLIETVKYGANGTAYDLVNASVAGRMVAIGCDYSAAKTAGVITTALPRA